MAKYHVVSRRRALGGMTAMLAARGAATAAGAKEPLRIAAIGGPLPAILSRFPVTLVDASESSLDGILLYGMNHEAALRHLKAGVPVWIDGPLASSMVEARKLIATAQQSKTAVMAATGAEFFPAIKHLRSRAIELAPLSAAMAAVSTVGVLETKWAGADAVNLLCAIFGTGVSNANRIVSRASQPVYTISFEYRRDRPLHIIAQGGPFAASRAWVRFYGTDLVDCSQPFSDEEGLPMALAMTEMFRTRKAPQAAPYLLAKTKLYLAACRSTSVPDGRQFAVTDLDENWRIDG